MKLLIFSLLFTYWAKAGDQYWVVNRDHSWIRFEISYLKLSKVEGKFNRYQGRILLDEKGEDPKSLGLEIFSKSIDTGISMRDGHLRSKVFLGVADYPKIIYQSDRIEKTGGDQYNAKGTLLFKGKKLPVTVKFEMTKVLEDTWDKENRFIKFLLKLNRSDLGISWNKTLKGEEFLLGENIEVKGTLQLQPRGKLTNSSKHKIGDNRYLRNKEKIFRGESVPKLKPQKRNVLKVEKASPVRKSLKQSLPRSNSKIFNYIAFLIVFIFGLAGSCGLVYLIYKKIDSKSILTNNFLDDSLKHFFYLVIVGGYVYFSSFLFPG